MDDHGHGMLTLADLEAQAARGELETVVAGFTDHYLLAVDMEMEPVEGYAFASWEQGYGDVHLVPDPATLRRADWLDQTAIVLCDVHDSRTHALAAVAPRSVLRGQVAALAERGLRAAAATELEHYLHRTSYADAARLGHLRAGTLLELVVLSIPAGRPRRSDPSGCAREIAQAALFLASDESSFVTGSDFVVDGGITAAYVTPE